MNIGHVSIDRPRFAAVMSLLIVIVGAIAYFQLPVTQYPEIAPPTIVVQARYPGATAEVIADTVATPIEQEMNGVENMLYMSSNATNDGSMTLTITFALGTNLDTAQVLVQNRVAVAEARLPEEVRRLGVVTRKSSPDLMMVIHLVSPDNSLDQLYISNYAMLQIRDVLARVDGVGDITVFGAREYAMRVWLDPDRLASLNLTAGDVVRALQAQNVQVSGGALGLPPNDHGNAFQVMVTTQGRFEETEQFRNVIVKAGKEGRLTRLSDVARIELGARSYASNSYLDGKQAVAIGVFQRPGSNALETADALLETMGELSRDFPPGMGHRVVYNPTEFIAESVNAVYRTIFEAAGLVILVIILFLQSWRAALIPIVAIPVSLIGTLAIMWAFGFSLNNLSLFGLVLAIGIVVDDAIVVVENIERNLEQGLSPREASRVTMSEVGMALVSIALVLSAVFIPTAFLGGISGQFFRQFAVTIAVATLISAFNSLTLSPALGSILLRSAGEAPSGFERVWRAALGPVFRVFDRGFDALRSGYAGSVCHVVRHPRWALLAFGLLLIATVMVMQRVPGGFIPQQDQGYVIVAVELPKGASLTRTDAVVQRATQIIKETSGAAHVVGIVGFSGATFTNASNAAAMFVTMKPFEERETGDTSSALVQQLWGRLSVIKDAQIFVIDPPPVRGLGTGGGFKAMVQDRGGQGLKALEAATWQLANAANQDPAMERVFSTFSLATPQLFLDIDRSRAEMLEVPVNNIFEALQINLGSAYVNDLNLFGRTYQVVAQADQDFRMTPDDIGRLRVRSSNGAMVPLGSVMEIRESTGPDRLVRHNLFPAAEIQGSYPMGVSSGDGLRAFEQLADSVLPDGISTEWTEIAYQERQSGNAGLLVFPLSVLLVFLLLTAQYESWTLPLAIIAIVPLAILFALLGVWVGGMENNILTQISFVVLIGLASKNAVLIVEFARQQEDAGLGVVEAALRAAELRLRPILMTSLAFMLGVVPLMLSTGAGSEMRQVLGTAVFSGMLGITIVGLFLTPAFYVMIRHMTGATDKHGADSPNPVNQVQ
jgi:HAE1 family hydrophobic/amphiphilic exporter-1